jgi:multidrug efflux system outer membrane protein
LDVPAVHRGTTDVPENAQLPDWWDVYPDESLRELLKTALAQNMDIGIAVARVDEARALARVSRLQTWPQVGVNADAARLRVSQIGTTVLLPGEDPTVNVFEADLTVSYEVDLWGRLRQLNTAARADWMASEYARRAVALAVVADVATAYFNLRSLDESRALVEKTISNREWALQLTRALVEHGSAARQDLGRAEANLATARASLPEFVRQAELAENQIQMLLGGNPAPISREVWNWSALPSPVAVPEGLPASLLERRPDIVEAEEALIAGHARWRATKAALLPTIELTGTLGTQSIPLAELFTQPAKTWSAGFGLLEPLISAGRNQYLVDAAQARERQAALQYRKTVQQAFREVSDALLSRTRLEELETAITVQIEALDRVHRQALRRFEVGSATSFEVVDSDRDLFAAQLAGVQARRNSLLALVQLYKALGGGWERSPMVGTR